MRSGSNSRTNETPIRAISNKEWQERTDVVVLFPASLRLLADQMKPRSRCLISLEQTGSIGSRTVAIRCGAVGFAMTVLLPETHLERLHDDGYDRLLQTMSCAVMNVSRGVILHCDGSFSNGANRVSGTFV
jgi:hypothetical protein